MSIEQAEQLAELLAHVKGRKRAGRWGIGTAESYLLQPGILDGLTGARAPVALREAA